MPRSHWPSQNLTRTQLMITSMKFTLTGPSRPGVFPEKQQGLVFTRDLHNDTVPSSDVCADSLHAPLGDKPIECHTHDKKLA